MRTSLYYGGLAVVALGCGSVGHWGSSDNSPSVSLAPGPNGGVAGSSLAGAPTFGTTTTAATPPPAISGGTMAVSGKTAIIADPDRDAIYLVDLASSKVTMTIGLTAGDEPGRVVVDAGGRAHVALRGGGAMVAIDLATGALLSRRAVCGMPRGLAYDAASDSVHVACATGELVTFPAASGDATRTLHLDMDLRDIVVEGKNLVVTRFRTAELLTVNEFGTVSGRRSPPDIVSPYMLPRVAWRMIPRTVGGGHLVVHQRASGAIDNSAAVSPGSTGGGGGGGYTAAAGGCASFGSSSDAVAASVTDFGSVMRSVVIPGLVLPVDVAMSPSGDRIAVVSAGNGHTQGGGSLFTIDSSTIPAGPDGCASNSSSSRQVNGQLTSVAFADDGALLAFSREPAQLFVVPANESLDVVTIPLSRVSREDTGHAVFHSNTGAGIACASCHAEGGDDAMVWTFSEQGRRRTPSLKGTLEGTAPYHWSGEINDTPALVKKVYEEGMGGPSLVQDQVDTLRGWLFAVPRPPVVTTVDATSAARGQALFEGAAGCSTCHSGAHLTNNATVDVGTGGAFQVPSLIGVAHRAPYLHDGCAATLSDRFGACGGGSAHGKANALSSPQLADLIAYLTTL